MGAPQKLIHSKDLIIKMCDVREQFLLVLTFTFMYLTLFDYIFILYMCIILYIYFYIYIYHIFNIFSPNLPAEKVGSWPQIHHEALCSISLHLSLQIILLIYL